MIEWIQFFRSYPAWVGWLAIGFLVYFVLLFMVLLFAERGAGLMMDAFRRVSEGDDVLMLEVKLRNTTNAAANINALRVEFFEKSKPKGGLQTSNSEKIPRVVVFYDIEAEKHLAKTEGSDLLHDVKVVFPYVGQGYGITTIPLEATINAKALYRFVVRFETDTFPRAGQKRAEGMVLYNRKKSTNAVTATITR